MAALTLGLDLGRVPGILSLGPGILFLHVSLHRCFSGLVVCFGQILHGFVVRLVARAPDLLVRRNRGFFGHQVVQRGGVAAGNTLSGVSNLYYCQHHSPRGALRSKPSTMIVASGIMPSTSFASACLTAVGMKGFVAAL